MQTTDPDYWLGCPRGPLQARVAGAPAELLAYIGDALALSPRPVGAQAGADTAAFVGDLRAALAELPRSLHDRLAAPLLGIFLARGLGCTGITEVVQAGARILGVAVVLDVDALMHHSANSWATWKEGRPFSAQTAARLRVTIAHGADDVRQNAIQFILLHEFGHVLTARAGWLPDWWTAPATLAPAERYAFLAPAWTIEAPGRIVPADAAHQAVHARLVDGALRQAPPDAALDLYQALGRTTWPTLYAANNAYEDFAECFALHLHTAVLGRPFAVSWVTEAGAERLLLDAASVVRRCADKFRFIARQLGAGAAGARQAALALPA